VSRPVCKRNRIAANCTTCARDWALGSVDCPIAPGLRVAPAAPLGKCVRRYAANCRCLTTPTVSDASPRAVEEYRFRGGAAVSARAFAARPLQASRGRRRRRPHPGERTSALDDRTVLGARVPSHVGRMPTSTPRRSRLTSRCRRRRWRLGSAAAAPPSDAAASFGLQRRRPAGRRLLVVALAA
jgi:hypothetical protein